MYQLDIITKIPESEPDRIIRIRPGESAFVRIKGGDSASSIPEVRGRPIEWMDKKFPALIIIISDDLPEIFRVFQAPDDPEYTVPFLAISSDRDALISCRAEGKILFSQTSDCSGQASESMQYLQEIIANTEYCIILCSQTNPAWIQLAGEIAQYARAQNTLTVLALTGEGDSYSYDNASDTLGKFHTVILTPNNSNSVPPISIEQIRDLCEATLDEIVASGGRHSLERNDPGYVRELLFNGGICYAPWHTVGIPDAHEILKRYLQPVQLKDPSLIGGTYSILKIPWESTINAALDLRNSLVGILVEKVPSKYMHYVRIEGYSPETEGQYDLIIWTFTGKYELSSIQRSEPEGKMPDIHPE